MFVVESNLGCSLYTLCLESEGISKSYVTTQFLKSIWSDLRSNICLAIYIFCRLSYVHSSHWLKRTTVRCYLDAVIFYYLTYYILFHLQFKSFPINLPENIKVNMSIKIFIFSKRYTINNCDLFLLTGLFEKTNIDENILTINCTCHT